ncbi:MAG TPA: ethanolamine utilization protein EutJ [Fibrobacteres bacterium]|jgi:branched-chain amino acid transport system substrate-binding protein|nr:ethanolamine utilization protein EutJ [Fibrobacterota bacterium]
MRFSSHIGTLGLAALIFGTGLTACNKKADSPNEILIGEYGSLTGGTATFGQSTHKGVSMAVEEINAAGGILGRKIKVITEDDQGKPEEAQTVVTKLISKDRVSAILGEVASSNSLAAAPVCQQNRIPMVTPASTNPKVTQIGDYVFRICFIDPFQGLVMAKFTFNSLKMKKVAILRDIKSDYSMGLADFFKQNFMAMGGEIVSDESYSQGDKDFNAQLTSIKGKNPEAVFVPGYYTEVGLIARQARKLGITGPLMGGDGWDSDKLWEIGGEALNGCFFSNHYSVNDPSPAIQNFVSVFRTKYGGETPDAMAALGYDAAKVLFDAIRRAGSDKPDSVRMALTQVQGYSGVTGSITLNENRDAVKPAVVLEVKDGKFAFKETVAP